MVPNAFVMIDKRNIDLGRIRRVGSGDELAAISEFPEIRVPLTNLGYLLGAVGCKHTYIPCQAGVKFR